MRICFRVHYRTEFGQQLRLLGSIPELGSGSLEQAPYMFYQGDGFWYYELSLPKTKAKFQYEYMVIDERSHSHWGEAYHQPRSIDVRQSKDDTIECQDTWRAPFRGSGVAIPVFSLRSPNGCGVGEFLDLIPMIDWAESIGMRMIQVLPINDTTAKHCWTDSYPYAAISVFALHPIYLRIDEMLQLSAKERKTLNECKKQLNELEQIDYEQVLTTKWSYIRKAYAQHGVETLETKEYQKFFKANKDWLRPYALYSTLRDRYKTCDFSQWGEFAHYKPAKLKAFENAYQSEVDLHYYVQFHLHTQLKTVSDYAHQHRVLLKGDIPIGIYRHSVDAWVNPDLYHMDCQAGAPPDAFSVTGQNWGFPTYNWERMAQDGYAWWTHRLTKMADYFHAFRIDHILGFFRIWQIPIHSVDGLLGYFAPAMPFSVDEIRSRGLWFDYERLCRPHIRTYMLQEIFGEDIDFVLRHFFEPKGSDYWRFKEDRSTQVAIAEFLARQDSDAEEVYERKEYIKTALFRLVEEVIFIEDMKQPGFFHPRIACHATYSYRELDEAQKRAFNALYDDFFYRRHNDFWREQALNKLPAIKHATPMLVCGEDLGMVPACVPGVMNELQILSLIIQRMPADSNHRFVDLHHIPYMSVCSPGSHDMSGVRAWWEEDRDTTQAYYKQQLHFDGDAPQFCEPYLARDIVQAHLNSPAMWAVFPLQDLLAMDSQLRLEDPWKERINEPSNPRHYWRYRLHLSMEDLAQQHEFNDALSQMIRSSDRIHDYRF